jgi:ferrous iron transport protein B
MEPVLEPMGFDWRIGVALIGAFAAKEVFVAQMGIVHAVGEADEGSESLREKLRQAYSRWWDSASWSSASSRRRAARPSP